MAWLGAARQAAGLLYYAADRWLPRTGPGHTHTEVPCSCPPCGEPLLQLLADTCNRSVLASSA